VQALDQPGGALAVQKDFLRCFGMQEGEHFFSSVQSLVRDFCVTYLGPRLRMGGAANSSNMKQKGGYIGRFMADASSLQTLLLFLQLNCEGHFLDMQL
jgi:hypothetical protein